MPSRTVRQASHESIEDSMNSYGSEGNLNFSGVHLASAGQFSDFLGSMGPAQFVGRQTLATTSMGDVEIGLQERNGQLEVDIIQARGLTPKPGSKTLPAAYIKAYLLENGVCIAKKKTKVARKSLDPLYNQVLLFPESPQGKVLQSLGKEADRIRQRSLLPIITHRAHPLFRTWTRSGVSRHLCLELRRALGQVQTTSMPKPMTLTTSVVPPTGLHRVVIVWGNYGRMERKHFMGVARVLLEELDLSTLAIGWYKLFPTSSMVDPTTGPLLRQSSQLSLESTVGPCCDRS
ncbi:regulating synaptic membrane exocytosis protein 4 isoform X1 [Athene cunicularia]|uniref:regulating synaptic membrane exocytosis protein 4 isoform X1 n=1 Tax=Athene cunicularia TaxID=194338 RepID=UPI000EF6A079|nr:regulating synaptic membrane exocytosis protein 4 isoform X1 [Athene cunicularia]